MSECQTINSSDTESEKKTPEPPRKAQDVNSLRCQLGLWHARGINSKDFAGLMQTFSDPADIFKAHNKTLASIGLTETKINQLKTVNWELVDKEIEWSLQDRHQIISWNDIAYPQCLKEIPSAPKILFVKGNIKLLQTPQLAMVGSRNPTPAGRENAYRFANFLAKTGFTITSGMALGIDAAAHYGALAATENTIAVIGTGIDRIYPARNQKLAYEISNKGAIISEFPLGTHAIAMNFPRRNRIISGLSSGVLIVEATLKSGSLITANYANEQNREVFAIPGSIHNPLARGSHALIRQGAKLVENAHDILEELQHVTNIAQTDIMKNTTEKSKLDSQHENLLNYIDHAATPIDSLVEESGIQPHEIASMLLMLELKGFIKAVTGGYMRVN